MGMYTALHFNSELNIPQECEVAEVLKYMVSDREDKPTEIPNHPLFKTERWERMFQCDSYYFDEDTHSTMRWDEIAKNYYLCLRFNVKNYDGEIEKFIDWIMLYLDKYETGEFLGFYRYEEDEDPTIIKYKKEM